MVETVGVQYQGAEEVGDSLVVGELRRVNDNPNGFYVEVEANGEVYKAVYIDSDFLLGSDAADVFTTDAGEGLHDLDEVEKSRSLDDGGLEQYLEGFAKYQPAYFSEIRPGDEVELLGPEGETERGTVDYIQTGGADWGFARLKLEEEDEDVADTTYRLGRDSRERDFVGVKVLDKNRMDSKALSSGEGAAQTSKPKNGAEGVGD